jgi:hypothetical protein
MDARALSDPLGLLAVVPRGVIHHAVTISVVCDCVSWVLKAHARSEDVLCFKQEGTDCCPCYWACFATLAHAIDAKKGVTGVR